MTQKPDLTQNCPPQKKIKINKKKTLPTRTLKHWPLYPNTNNFDSQSELSSGELQPSPTTCQGGRQRGRLSATRKLIPQYPSNPARFFPQPTSQSPSGIEASMQLLSTFEELFIKYGVDTVLAGNKHSYERKFPIARSAPIETGVSADNSTYADPKAPVCLITGAAGNVEDHTTNHSNTVPWNAASDNSHRGVSIFDWQIMSGALGWMPIALFMKMNPLQLEVTQPTAFNETGPLERASELQANSLLSVS